MPLAGRIVGVQLAAGRYADHPTELIFRLAGLIPGNTRSGALQYQSLPQHGSSLWVAMQAIALVPCAENLCTRRPFSAWACRIRDNSKTARYGRVMTRLSRSEGERGSCNGCRPGFTEPC